MYESAHFISSRAQSDFPGFPMPDDYPDYPGHRDILAYIREFADAFDLRRFVRPGTGVEAANYVEAETYAKTLDDVRRRAGLGLWGSWETAASPRRVGAG